MDVDFTVKRVMAHIHDWSYWYNRRGIESECQKRKKIWDWKRNQQFKDCVNIKDLADITCHAAAEEIKQHHSRPIFSMNHNAGFATWRLCEISELVDGVLRITRINMNNLTFDGRMKNRNHWRIFCFGRANELATKIWTVWLSAQWWTLSLRLK